MKKLSFPLVIVGLLVWWISSFGEATAGPLLAPLPVLAADRLLQGPASPLTATLTMPFVPGVNQPALLFITVGSSQDAPLAAIEAAVSDVDGQHIGFNLITGFKLYLPLVLKNF